MQPARRGSRTIRIPDRLRPGRAPTLPPSAALPLDTAMTYPPAIVDPAARPAARPAAQPAPRPDGDCPPVEVILPALDEEAAIGGVLAALPRDWFRRAIVVDNGSTDGTAAVAAAAGAHVVHEPRRGYGSACLAGLAALHADTEVIVFLDADGSDAPDRLPGLVAPILAGEADLVIGSRVTAHGQRGALTLPQRTGNAIATAWLRGRFGLPATDLGPFRAIRRSSLKSLHMSDPDWGWTVEMQIKAARAGLRYREVTVPCFRRIGRSKISGTVRGVLGAAFKILGLLAWHDFVRPGSRRRSAPPVTANTPRE